ncbi:transmembrane protein 45B-like [Ylistrum balloti]|uniref:transmembrane protein 45B-like n=1 Tax=Ylistrum balloti TaxID=509963 RepID=UPI0029058832|nr:transmembrane protein 45B-like [Ylistrum balloti]
MGNFEGHALPGSFFIVFALWWTVQMFHRYLTCQRQNLRFTSTPTYPCVCLCGKAKNWPIESLLKLFFTSVGIIGEIYTGFNSGKFTTPENGQHATMFFFFGLTGIMDLLVYFRFPVLKDIEYVSMIIAVTVEGMLFKFHLHGRDGVDVLVHTLLVYTISASVLALLAEMRWRDNILIALSRPYFILLQGTWFWQIAFILHNPLPGAKEWNSEDHHSYLIATMYFAWHCGVAFITMFLIGVCMTCFHKKYRSNDNMATNMMSLMTKDINNLNYKPLRKDSDNSDFEP